MLINLLLVTVIILLMSITCLVIMYCFYLSYILDTVDGLEVQLEEVRVEEPSPGVELPDEVYEELKYEDTEFDKRIARLKEELIRDNFSDVERIPTEATIGAKGIYNLPHDTEAIQRGGDNNIEISE